MPSRTNRLRSRVQQLATRLRGYQTLSQLRRLGLDAGEVQIAGRTLIDPRFAWAVSIGDGTVIAHDVRVIAHDAASRQVVGYTAVHRVVIGCRCYIGAGSVILPGVVIGDGAIIGAGSVVRRDIPADTVALGIPAKPVSSVAEFADRQRAAMAGIPRHELTGRQLTKPLRAQARRELEEHGRIYIR